MTPSDLLGGRVALWWAGAYAATADPQMAAERRDELRADLHDHLQQGLAEGCEAAQVSRAMLGRTVRGIPSDVLWRFEIEWARDQLRSLVAEPTTVLGLLFLTLLPISLLADAARRFDFVPVEAREGLTVVCGFLYTFAVAYLLTAASMRFFVRQRLIAQPLRQRLLRFLRLVMFASFALSGIWRFAPDPYGQISAWAWAVFGLSLVANGIVLLVRAACGRKKALDLGKVPS